jgi:hypothetical protein
MKQRNKAYRPKPIMQNPLNYIIGGLKRLTPDSLTDLNVKNHAALYLIVTGAGTTDSADKLIGCVNMANVMSQQGIGKEYRDDIILARDAMQSPGKRFAKWGKFEFTGSELAAINQFMAIHDAQLEAARIIDVERAYDEVYRRLKHGIDTVSMVAA